MEIYIILFIIFILFGVLMSYDGNPIKGYIAIWCNVTKYHEKEWKKNPDEAFVCKKCGGMYYKAKFKVL